VLLHIKNLDTGTIILAVTHQIRWETVTLAIVMMILIGLSVTAGYHRLFSHKSYTAAWPVRLVMLLFGAAAFENSVLEWGTDHRQHHRYTDTERDPYNIKKGFWYAHIGWIFLQDPIPRDYSNVEDLKADPFVRFQHRFYVPVATIMGIGLPTAIAAFWGDAWGGFIIAGFLRLIVTHHTTFCINSVCHWFGKQTYKQQSARDSWVTALFTFGEGYHNFHHQFAIDYRNGIRFYDFDPTKWLIRGMAYMGLARNLKQVSKEQIIRYRIQTEESQIVKPAHQHLEQFVQPLRDRILKAAAYIDHLEKEYIALKKEKMLYLQDKWLEYRTHLQTKRQSLKQAHQELRDSLAMWGELLRTAHLTAAKIPNN